MFILSTALLSCLGLSFPTTWDHLLLKDVAMIMTHDSATGYLPNYYNPIYRWAKTQIGGFPAQLDCGARAFDVRPKLKDNGDFIFHHGDVEVNKDVGEALAEIEDWLSNNQDEVVILDWFSCAGNGCSQKLEDLLKINNYPMEKNCDVFKTITLGEAREKYKLTTGGALINVDDVTQGCVAVNYDDSITCYGQNWESSVQSVVPYKCYPENNYATIHAWNPFWTYVDNTLTNNDDRLKQVQAHWQYDQTAIAVAIMTVGAYGSIINDEQDSQMNAKFNAFLHDTEHRDKVKIVNVDNVCNGGNKLYDTLHDINTKRAHEPCTCETPGQGTVGNNKIVCGEHQAQDAGWCQENAMCHGANSVPFDLKASLCQPDPIYPMVEEVNVNCAAKGWGLLNEEECKLAAASMFLEYRWNTNGKPRPEGCYRKSNRVYYAYNPNNVGKGSQSDRKQMCKFTGEPSYPSVMEDGATCASMNRAKIDSEEDCWDAAAALGLVKGWVTDNDQRPEGCYRRKHKVFWSIASTDNGSDKDRKLICQPDQESAMCTCETPGQLNADNTPVGYNKIVCDNPFVQPGYCQINQECWKSTWVKFEHKHTLCKFWRRIEEENEQVNSGVSIATRLARRQGVEAQDDDDDAFEDDVDDSDE